jgi:hypothetical protein
VAYSSVILKAPAAPESLHVGLYIPDSAPGRTVKMFVDQAEVASRTFPGPGVYAIDTAPVAVAGASALVTVTIYKTVTIVGDPRALGLILTEIGFRAGHGPAVH